MGSPPVRSCCQNRSLRSAVAVARVIPLEMGVPSKGVGAVANGAVMSLALTWCRTPPR